MGLGGQTHKTPTTQWNSTSIHSAFYPRPVAEICSGLVLEANPSFPGVWLHPVWLHPKTQLKLFWSRYGGLLYSRAFFHPTYLCRARLGQEGSAEA